MRNSNLLKLAFICTIIVFNINAWADKITIAADPWVPYTGTDEENPGIILEMAKEIFKDAGHEVKYDILPWSRAIVSARNGTINAIAGCFKEEAPDFIFPENEQGLSSYTIYIRKSSKWKYSGIESIKKIRLGVIQDYSYGKEIDKHIKPGNKSVHILSADDAIERLFKLLKGGRIDAAIVDNLVAQNLIKKLDMTNDIKPGGSVGKPTKLWIGFSPNIKNSNEYAKILSDGMAKIRANGRYEMILKKYGIE